MVERLSWIFALTLVESARDRAYCGCYRAIYTG